MEVYEVASYLFSRENLAKTIGSFVFGACSLIILYDSTKYTLGKFLKKDERAKSSELEELNS